MGLWLKNAEVLVKLSENVYHAIDTLHAAGLLAPHIEKVIVEVKNSTNHRFSVQWGRPDKKLDSSNTREYLFDDYLIKVDGGASQSRAIATVVMGCVRTSLHMLEPDRNEVL